MRCTSRYKTCETATSSIVQSQLNLTTDRVAGHQSSCPRDQASEFPCRLSLEILCTDRLAKSRMICTTSIRAASFPGF